MKKRTGIERYVLCIERRFACSTASAGKGAPATIAAMIDRSAGQMRRHTLPTITVANEAPRWMNKDLPDMIRARLIDRPASSVNEAIVAAALCAASRLHSWS